jgi:hypothetical protein
MKGHFVRKYSDFTVTKNKTWNAKSAAIYVTAELLKIENPDLHGCERCVKYSTR